MNEIVVILVFDPETEDPKSEESYLVNKIDDLIKGNILHRYTITHLISDGKVLREPEFEAPDQWIDIKNYTSISRKDFIQ